MKRLLFLAVFFCSGVLNAQSYLGTWTSYLPYNKASNVTVAGSKVYCSTNGGLFYYNIFDKSLNKLSRENGLSDSDISALGWSEENSCLVIAYRNANIDLIKGNKIINIPDIYEKQILGEKSINSITFRDDKAYLSCGFGIVVLNLSKNEISESYFIGNLGSSVNVIQTVIHDSKIYAASNDGIYFADFNNQNLVDFNQWSKLNRFSGADLSIHSISSSGSGLFIAFRNNDAQSDSILQLKEQAWITYPHFQSEIVPFIKAYPDGLLICSRFSVDFFNLSGELSHHIYTGNPIMAEMDSDDNIWIADFRSGLVSFPSTGYPEILIPEGPSGIDIFDLAYSNGRLAGVAGGSTGSWNNIYRNGAIYRYNGKKWENWETDSIRDLVEIIIDPSDPDHYYAASWGYGLFEFRGSDLVKRYGTQNSSLQNIIPGQNYIRIAGLDYDRQGNLWITNSGVSSPLSVLKNDGSWVSFEIANKMNGDNLGDIIVTQSEHKWIVLPKGNGLFVFDDNNTIDNPDDDSYKQLSIVDKNRDLISNEVYSIAEDRDGNIWVGTNQGPVVYYSPSRVFDENNFYAQQIIIPRNDGSGLGDPLLGTESITSIEIDGANRKWLGTRDGGVYLVSEDGLTQIHEFNISNSPLLSNSILDIAIADETGEVFFGTENGIISFVGKATVPDEAFNDVYVYPNPVREDYTGEIVIAGLVEDTYIKITDLNGNLVYEGISLGGQAIWDGNNFQGDRVATGVYLVFCSTSDGLQTHVTKLLFIH